MLKNAQVFMKASPEKFSWGDAPRPHFTAMVLSIGIFVSCKSFLTLHWAGSMPSNLVQLYREYGGMQI